MAHSII